MNNNTKQVVTQTAWNDFIKVTKERIERVSSRNKEYVLSEETFRLDYALSLSKYMIASTSVFAEYPCDKAESQKWDIYIDDQNGDCIEIKFFRPIPSGYNPPFTQHLGALLSDILKLTLLSNNERNKYLVVIADDKFSNYFINQDIIKSATPSQHVLQINLTSLQSTAQKEIEKRLKNITVPGSISITVNQLKYDRCSNFSIYLLEISSG